VPCLVFTDLHMSPVNGFEFIAWIRRQPQLRDVQVIALIREELASDTMALATGPSVCLPKFPSPEELLAALKTN
jgi:CheY-like chemotaxis protein